MKAIRIRKGSRQDRLLVAHFTPLEARELSKTSLSTPAMQLIIASRLARWTKFERAADRKIAIGQWKRDQVSQKWLQNLSRMYHNKRWRVQYGPKGNQQPMVKGGVNPWAMFREAERAAGGPGTKRYKSPWEARQLAGGKTRLEKGLIFVQRVEQKTKRGDTLNAVQIRQWIAEKEVAISGARGKRQEQLILERNRLERLL
jgi:hypothetical protein